MGSYVGLDIGAYERLSLYKLSISRFVCNGTDTETFINSMDSNYATLSLLI